MNYISTVAAAKKWGISTTRITILANEGRIPDAIQVGMRWMIPENAEKPKDARTKAVKNNKTEPDSFRFPIFEHRVPDSFYPPLNEEELQMKAVAEAFYACRIDEADRLLGDLPETTTDRYRRISTLYEGCMIDIANCNTERFFSRYAKLRAELQEDFPHKLEMQEYLNELDALLGNNEYYCREFKFHPGYPYHESFLPHLSSLCAVSFSIINRKLNPADLNNCEANCMLLDNSQAYTDAQATHIYLGTGYAMMKMYDEMTYHFHKALVLAEKYELYYIPCIQYYYLRNMFAPAMSEFSDAFKNKLESLSDQMHEGYLRFMNEISMNSIYKILTQKDYIYLYYAVLGYTNKAIAKLFNVSECTVSNRYIEMYALLGVKNKSELIKLYNKTINPTLQK